jgi:predicted TIM-barrel fold metal-dependent hydrolase
VIDLANEPAVDVHCHPWRTEHLLALDPLGFENRITMTGMCLISSGLADEETERHLNFLTESTPLVLAMRRRLAEYLGCEATQEAVAAARREAIGADPAGYCAALWADARVAGLIYDEGYPQPTIAREDFAAASAARIHRVGRIEPWIAELRGDAGSFAELEDAFVARVELEGGDGELVAFKSVIAYRTGLDVGSPTRDECERGFEHWRADGFRETREHAKPVRDALLRRTLEVAKRGGRPVHIHCGGGDPSIVFSHARPQDLFQLLAEHADQPIVLIHSGWPWLEEGAFVASVLPQVYLDTSLTTPWGNLAIDQKLEVLLGIAPPAKVLYGSDESTEPEVIWLSAQLAREGLGRVLTSAVERRWLDEGEARSIGEGVLAGNARRLHGIEA